MSYYSRKELEGQGVALPEGSVCVHRSVPLDALAPGAILHAGVRIEGESTIVGPACELGRLGPVFIKDAAFGHGASVARGSVENATLLDGASLGPDAHVRAGTLLEESASTAHAVGLKQTILFPFAALGSQINFCDALLAGGRSRDDHSEVGSGFIHFNFTPFGKKGDKATPSLFGDVPRGVLLDENRIFLGGAGGVVGPIHVGYGCILAAGSVFRRDYGEDVLVYGESLAPRQVRIDEKRVPGVTKRYRRSLAYMGQLRALHAFYRIVRRPMATDPWTARVLDRALDGLDVGVAERARQLDRLFEGLPEPSDTDRELAATWKTDRTGWMENRPLGDPERLAGVQAILEPGRNHLEWVRSLDEKARTLITSWLEDVARVEG